MSSYVDMADGGETAGLGTAARSLGQGADGGAAALQAVGFGSQSRSNRHAPSVPDTEG